MSRVFFVLLCFFLASQLTNARPSIKAYEQVPLKIIFDGVPTEECLNALKITPDLVKVLAAFHHQTCYNISVSHSPVCRFAEAHINKQDLSQDEPQSEPQGERMERDVQSSMLGDDFRPVFLNVYKFIETHPAFNLLKCIDPEVSEQDKFYYSSISYAGSEYQYGFDGIRRLPEGTGPFVTKVKQVLLAEVKLSSKGMDELVGFFGHHGPFTAKNYNPLKFNDDTFTDSFARVIKNLPVSKVYQEPVTELAKTDSGLLLKAALRLLKL